MYEDVRSLDVLSFDWKYLLTNRRVENYFDNILFGSVMPEIRRMLAIAEGLCYALCQLRSF